VKLGIDIDTWKLTLCALDGPYVHPSVVAFETAKIRQRGDSFFDAIQGVAPALSLAVSRLPGTPEEVYIERGRGAHRAGEYELGAIYGATAVAVRRAIPNAHVETVPLHEWKKAVTAAVGITTKAGVPGNGNAKKPEANAACLEILQNLGLTHGGLSADELDAFGIVWSQISVPVLA
jgi:hypothetical protein